MTDKKDFETGSHENLEGENRAQLAFFTTVRFGGLSAFSWSDYMQAETWTVISIQPKEVATQRRELGNASGYLNSRVWYEPPTPL